MKNFFRYGFIAIVLFMTLFTIWRILEDAKTVKDYFSAVFMALMGYYFAFVLKSPVDVDLRRNK